MKRRAQAAGYTLVEVMLAVSVLFLGTAGFTFMQGASARAIQGAQEQAVAVHVLETWMDRIRRDALFWRAPGLSGFNDSTQYLTGTFDEWRVPPVVEESSSTKLSYAADAYGRDVPAGSSARFCINVRVRPAHYWTPTGGAVPANDNAIDALRVDVRVWWSRRGVSGVTELLRADGGEKCDDVPDSSKFTPNLYQSVMASTLVRWR